MTSHLVVVESPAKANTIKKYLGPGYEVLASYGHVRDLRPKEGAVDTESGFAMNYEVIDRNAKHVDAIAKAMKKADALYLATDLDREGEAISWHLVELLRDRKLLENKPIYRVVFHEITKRAIEDAVANPREISMDLVNAQQARRALDYLVGFNLSPLLWKKINRGLSAGRVQSPALRLIVEREQEIDKFQPREYWSVDAEALAGKKPVQAKLWILGGEKVKQFTITDEATATAARATLMAGAEAQGKGPGKGQLIVEKVERKQRKRNPAPPFITSTLQQEAVRKLGMTANRAMRVAQGLYEGVEIGNETIGLITYMRTDSTNLADEALAEMREFVGERYGADQVPKQPRVFKTKSKNAQEAHEAIRPTAVRRTPEDMKKYLDRDQMRLYELIWKRTVACQMVHATINTVAADLACGEGNTFRANGSQVAEPGFMAVYMESNDDQADEEEGKMLPPLEEGDRLALKDIIPAQHFTEPPPRYTEASLVKTLEEYGIGRPSTYASIISTLLNREYVELDSKRFRPTDMGRTVNRFLTEHFDTYVDYEFTARLEDELDAISRGEKAWVPLMEQFWQPFKEQVEDKDANVSRRDAQQVRELGTHPKSGKPVSVRMGRYGPYVQIGSSEDEDKPQFVSLRGGQSIETITLDEALELTKLPRALGETADGEPVSANIGRFGPYVRFGSKYASIPEGDDPYTIELPRALELIEEKKQADAARHIKDFEGTDIRILNGRYGPYITNGKKNARVPKDREPASIELAEAEELLAKAPEARRGGRRRTKKKAS